MLEREGPMSEELIILVDGQGNPIGTAPKLESHNENTPLHLAFSCYVFDNKGEFLVTQRAKSKKVFPGIWSNSCCGHPAPGEKVEKAIKRHLKFELGLSVEKLIAVLPDFRYTAEMNGIVENEICPVYLARISGEPKPNKEEVENYHWLKWEEWVKETEENPQRYSVWSVEQTRRLKNNPLIKRFSLPDSRDRKRAG
jgi:isopentenyl-diphosphate delta-isomerase